MKLDGVAQSNASVAAYMRNIERSPWMGHADLRKTENSHDGTRMPYRFGLNVSLSRPKTENVQAADGSPAAASTALGAPAAPASAAPTMAPAPAKAGSAP